MEPTSPPANNVVHHPKTPPQSETDIKELPDDHWLFQMFPSPEEFAEKRDVMSYFMKSLEMGGVPRNDVEFIVNATSCTHQDATAALFVRAGNLDEAVELTRK